MKTTNKTHRITSNILKEFPLQTGDFFTDENMCFIGNVEGLFDREDGYLYLNDDMNDKRSLNFFEGLSYRINNTYSSRKTIIVGEEKVINSYKNLFQDITGNTAFTTNAYDFDESRPMTNNVMFVILGENDWENINDNSNVFSRFMTYINNMKFDHIIANPPFSVGNKITAAVLENLDFDQYVNLMPASKYKKDKLYQYIVPNSLSPVEWTGDAETNPQICLLSKERFNTTEEEFNVMCYDPRFKKFYTENAKRKSIFSEVLNHPKNDSKLNAALDFQTTNRCVQDGVHKTPDCWDYKWNINKDASALPYDNYMKRIDACFFRFNTEAEFNNFCNYWYRRNLSNKLLLGLHKNGGVPTDAIPRVDWSHPWTDEEILKDYGYSDEEIAEILK